jgi:hypothetical protein
MEKEYVIVTWPESQWIMDKEWYDECVLINEEPLLSQVGSSAYFVPKSRLKDNFIADSSY